MSFLTIVPGNNLFGDITLLVNSWLLKVTVLPVIKEDTFVNAKVLPIPIAEDIVFPAPIKIDVEPKLTTDNPKFIRENVTAVPAVMVTDAVLAVPIKTDVVPRPTIDAFVIAVPTVIEFPIATPERLVTKI